MARFQASRTVSLQNSTAETLPYTLRVVRTGGSPSDGLLYEVYLLGGDSPYAAILRERDPVSGVVLRTIDLPRDQGLPSTPQPFTDRALAFDGRAVYMVGRDGNIVQVSLEGTLLNRFPGTHRLDGLAASAREVFAVGTDGQIVAINTDTGATRSIPLPDASFEAVRLAYGGRRGSLFVADGRTGPMGRTVVEIDARTGAVRGQFQTDVDLVGIAYSDERNVLYLKQRSDAGARVWVADPSTGAISGEVPVAPPPPYGPVGALAADGAAVPSFLSVAPVSGSLVAGASEALALTFRATRLTAGVYEARLDAESGGAVVASLPLTFRVTGSPKLRLRRTAIALGDVLQGDVARDSFYVGNTGTAPLSVSLAASGEFGVTPASVTLAPRDSALVRVSFTATRLGSQSAPLVLTTNDPSVPTRSVSLQAEGIRGAEIGVAPESLAATVAAGASTTRALVVSNTGDRPLTYTARIESAEGGAPALFGIASGNRIGQFDPVTYRLVRSFPTDRTSVGGADLLATDGSLLYYVAASEQVVQVFDPATGTVVRRFPVGIAGGLAHDGTRLFVAGNLASRAVARFTPDGTAVEALLRLPDETVFDGDMAVDSGVLYLLTRTQNGAGSRQVLRLDAETGAVLGAFGLPAGSPSPVGIAVAGADLLVAVSPTAVLALDPTTGALRRQSEYLSTDGPQGALAFSARFVSWAAVTPVLGTIEAGGSAAATVRFDASRLFAGTYRGNVVVASNDRKRPEARVPFTLTVTGAPNIALSPARLDFGDVASGGVAEREVVVRNAGTASLTVAVASSDAAVTASLVEATVAPGEQLRVVVRYAPAAPGVLSGRLTLTSNDPDEGTVQIELSGRAVAAPVAILTLPDVFEPTAPVGQTAAAAVTIRNTGAVPLRYAVVGRSAGAPAPELYVLPRGERTIRRVDPLSGATRGTILLPGEGDVSAIAASAEALYVSEQQGRVRSLTTLDRTSGAFVRSVPIALPSQVSIGALTHDGARLLALVGGSGGALVNPINAETGVPSPAVPFQGGSRRLWSGLAAGRGLLVSRTLDFSVNRSEIVAFDPTTGEIRRALPVAASPHAFVDGRLYAQTDSDGASVLPLDPATGNRVVGPALPDGRVAGWGPTVPWVDLAFGTVAPGAEAVVTVSFPSGSLSPGTVEGTLAVVTDDPLALETTRPVRFTVTGGTPGEAPPAESAPFAVRGPTPNPSRDGRTLTLSLPGSSLVRIDVFDVTGRLVWQLPSADLSAGTHQVELSGSLPAGTYVARVQAGTDVASRRFVVVR